MTSARGFTLIEMMAVVAIMAMVFVIGLPRLDLSTQRLLRDEAEAIASSLDYARQRAIMTAVPHRLLIDLQDGGYRIEWLVTEDEAVSGMLATGTESRSQAGFGGLPPDPSEADSISLRPPEHPERAFVPIPHREHGAFRWIDDALYFVGLESPGGWLEGGNVAIVFQADGTTDSALLELADVEDHHMTLEIEPILDRVRRRDGSARS